MITASLRPGSRWDLFWSDTKSGLRSLRHNLVFSGAVVLIMATGIGLNAAMFRFVYAVVIQPLPYAEPGRVVLINGPSGQSFTQMGGPFGFEFNRPEFEQSKLFCGISLYTTGGLNLETDPPERVGAAAVTGDFFKALGARPVWGRRFTRTDVLGTQQLVVIGERLWRRRFDSDPAVIGRAVRLNGQLFTVTGVLPQRAQFPAAAEVWIPSGGDQQITGEVTSTTILARLSAGVTVAAARDEILRISGIGRNNFVFVSPSMPPPGVPLPDRGQVEAQRNASDRRMPVPRDRSEDVQVRTLEDAIRGDVTLPAWLVSMAAFVVLLVACFNVANLLLTHVFAEERQLAIRSALGASRWDICRLVIAESLLLSIAAAALSLPLVWAALRLTAAIVPPTVHGAVDLKLDLRVFPTVAASTIFSCVLIVAGPAVSTGASRFCSLLVNSGAGLTTNRTAARLRSAFVVAQIAAAFGLLAVGSTFMWTVHRLMTTDIGASEHRAVAVDISPPRSTYGTAQAYLGLWQRLDSELKKFPAIDSFGRTSQLIGEPDAMLVASLIRVEGRPTPTLNALSAIDRTRALAVRIYATPGYFRAAGIDLVAGRLFTEADGASGQPVAVISESVAHAVQLGPKDVIGRRYTLGAKRAAVIVGVVRDVKLRGPEGPYERCLYLPYAQEQAFGPIHLAVKGTDVPAAIRLAVAKVDRALPVRERTFDEIRRSHMLDRWLTMLALLLFGVVALGLAAGGLFAILSYLVQLTRRDIGIRMALGATPSITRWHVVGSGLVRTGIGIICGTAAAVAVSQVLQSRVVGLATVDPVTLFGLGAGFEVVALLATSLPAARATHVDPVVALRSE